MNNHFKFDEVKEKEFLGENLSGTYFENCDLTGTSFRNCNLNGAQFDRCKAAPGNPVVFSNANMKNVKMKEL